MGQGRSAFKKLAELIIKSLNFKFLIINSEDAEIPPQFLSHEQG